MPLHALLIDFGGTLATEVPSRGELYARSARARGIEISGEAMAAHMGAVHRALPRVVDDTPRYSDAWFGRFIDEVFHVRLGLGRDELPSLEEELFARFADAASFRIFPGAVELLEAARSRGLGVAVVSNWSEHLDELLTNLSLAPHVDRILSSAIVGAEKPDRAIFDAALDALGAEPHEALHCGNDLACDVEGARGAGIHTVLVDHRGDLGAPPDVERVTSLQALMSKIDGSASGSVTWQGGRDFP